MRCALDERAARALPALALALSAALLSTAPTVQAQTPAPDTATSAEEHSRRGVEFYAEGKLPEAVREMLKAYELAPESGLLYNIARIYQKMGQRDLAVHYLKEFVTQPGADPDRVQKALEHLEELNRASAAPPPAETPLVDEVPPAPPKVEAAPPPTEPSPSPVTPTPQASGPDHTAAWVALGVGGGALVVGGVLGGLALDRASDLTRPGVSYGAKRDAQRSSRSFALGADVCIGVGVAAATVGLVLLLTGGDDPSAATVAPTFGPHHAGAQLMVRFP